MLASGIKLAMWSIEDHGGYADAQLSGTTKNPKTNEWEKDWSSKCRLYGRAYDNLKDYKLGENEFMEIRIGWGYETESKEGKKFKQAPFKVKNFSKEHGYKYTNYFIFDAEPIVSDKPKAESTPEISMEIPDTIQESLPFR